MAKKILNIATFGLAGALFHPFGKDKKPDGQPPKSTPPIMPAPDDEAILRAKRNSIIRQRARHGRDSTILSDETLGGG